MENSGTVTKSATPPVKTTTFSIASPEAPTQEHNDNKGPQESGEYGDKHRERVNEQENGHRETTGNEGTSENAKGRGYETETETNANVGENMHEGSRIEQNTDNPEDASGPESSDLTFKKKDVNRSRTQSFQSVLSTASLKSLRQQDINSTAPPTATNRNNSIISTAPSNIKNFQSFIQAPVLSSVSNLKNVEDMEIGRQLPFNNKSSSGSNSSDKSENNANEEAESSVGDDDGSYDDHDTMIQQQKLTLNALKKLSLSPMLISNNDQSLPKKLARKPSQKKVDSVKTKVHEPYQPAEVDLSSFASLTRQPKMPQPPVEASPEKNPQENESKKQLPKLEEEHQGETTRSKAQEEYHKELRLQQINYIQKQQPQLTIPSNSKIPAAVIPPQSMNTRRQSAQHQIPNGINKQHTPVEPHLGHSLPQSQPLHTPAPNAPQQPNNQNLSSQASANLKKQLQQIKGLRSPMYVPAVLRMTVNGVSSSQPTSHNSTTSLNDERSTSPKNCTDHATSFHNLEPSSSTASIRSVDSGMSIESNASGKVHGKTNFLGSSKKNYEDILKAPPTRKHWVKDEVVFKCSIPSCPKVFNFFERRHHCRKCGRIFCKEHTSHYLYINHLTQFTTGGRGTLSKVCDLCISEYNEFIQNEFGVSINHNSHSSHNNRQDSASEPVSEPGSRPSGLASEPVPPQSKYRPSDIGQTKIPFEKKDITEQLVGSVPANWSWSSF